MNKLEQIRAKIKAQEAVRSGNGAKRAKSDAVYPFWDSAIDDVISVRFLPDGDKENTFFWREKQTIRLPFSGIVGIDTNGKEVTVEVPCIEMWEEYKNKCPVHNELRTWYKTKDPDLEKLASTYWKKVNYLYQGFVRQAKMQEKEVPENPIRLFWINKKLHGVIKPIIFDPDLVASPDDYEQGLDFRITKTKSGQYNEYTTSTWARASTPLTQFERDSIEKYGLFNLSELMPKMPNSDELAAIYEMFQASINGELYDPTRWGKFYLPYGYMINDGGTLVSRDDRNNQSYSKPSAPSHTVTVSSTTSVAAQEDDIPFDIPDTNYTPRVNPVQNQDSPQPANKQLTAAEMLAALRQKQQNG